MSWKEKKEHNFFSRSLGNNSAIGVPSLQRNKPAFVKSLEAGLTFCFFPLRSRAGVPGGEASGLTFEAAISVTGATAFTIIWIRIARGEGWNRVRDRTFHDVIVNVSEESRDEFHNFDNKVDFQITPIISMLDQAVVH